MGTPRMAVRRRSKARGCSSKTAKPRRDSSLRPIPSLPNPNRPIPSQSRGPNHRPTPTHRPSPNPSSSRDVPNPIPNRHAIHRPSHRAIRRLARPYWRQRYWYARRSRARLTLESSREPCQRSANFHLRPLHEMCSFRQTCQQQNYPAARRQWPPRTGLLR